MAAKPQGQWVNAFNLADRYLRALGWPSTPTSRRVLAAWFMRESPHKGTDVYVIGNNPLNMTTTGGSYWLSGGGKYKIAIYPSEDAGIRAFSNRIHSSHWGYPVIVDAFKNHSDSGSAMILAINNSGWVNGRFKHAYVYKNKAGQYTINGLLSTFNAIGGNDLNPNDVVYSGKTQDATAPTLTAWNGLVSYPKGYVLKSSDINNIADKLDAAGYFNDNSPLSAAFSLIPGWNFVIGTPHDIAKKQFIAVMNKNAVGKSWDKSLETTLGTQIHEQANADKNPVNLLPNVVQDVLGALAGKAIAFAAIGVGVGLVIFGAWLVAKDVYNQTGSGMLDVTPIIVRG